MPRLQRLASQQAAEHATSPTLSVDKIFGRQEINFDFGDLFKWAVDLAKEHYGDSTIEGWDIDEEEFIKAARIGESCAARGSDNWSVDLVRAIMDGRAGEDGWTTLKDYWIMLYRTHKPPTAAAAAASDVTDLDRIWCLLILLPQIVFGSATQHYTRQASCGRSRIESFYAGDWDRWIEPASAPDSEARAANRAARDQHGAATNVQRRCSR